MLLVVLRDRDIWMHYMYKPFIGIKFTKHFKWSQQKKQRILFGCVFSMWKIT
jgi:hypothetical protein